MDAPDSGREALLGWGGLSPRYWAVALELQDERVVETYRALAAAPRGTENHAALFRQLHIEAHFLLVALSHILRSLKRCAEVLGNPEIKAIRDDFETRAPWIKHFRDVLEHLDEYTLGKGQLQNAEELAVRAGPILTFGPFERPWEAVIQLGSWRLPLRASAEAGSKLGHALAAEWEEQFGPEQPRVIWGRSP
jgi:hypothetical protein